MKERKQKKALKAIDLYSGIGGWSLGFAMAGIEIVDSYEWWDRANLTNQINNRHPATETDIRQLELTALPEGIDIVVGSPPCTQFSFSNRGGNGDIDDGLKDIAKFLSVVDYLRPKFWAMENVPRVAGIIRKELQPNGKLSSFSHLKPNIGIFDICEWGLPQRRQRCIIGNFDFSLLNGYKNHIVKKTLGDVVSALSMPVVKDPIYCVEIAKELITDHEIEDFLSAEEERMNREMKTFHPVYNNMSFPDPLHRTARTVTATCTRVSRESIVISAPEKSHKYRRLSVRERSCLQGFPITFRFYGNSYSQKLKMIGNAIPPLFTFYIAQAMLGISPDNLMIPGEAIKTFTPPKETVPETPPDIPRNSYPSTRRFRAAIPHLRFKSGVRFELSNSFGEKKPIWAVKFFFGNSKDIKNLPLDMHLLKALQDEKKLLESLPSLSESIAKVQNAISSTDNQSLQDVWAHRASNGSHPYDLVDVLGEEAKKIIIELSGEKELAGQVVKDVLARQGETKTNEKVQRYSVEILAGLLIGASANSVFDSVGFNDNK